MPHVTENDRGDLWERAAKLISPPADSGVFGRIVAHVELIAAREYKAGYEAAMRDVLKIVSVDTRRVIAGGLLKLDRERQK